AISAKAGVSKTGIASPAIIDSDFLFHGWRRITFKFRWNKSNCGGRIGPSREEALLALAAKKLTGKRGAAADCLLRVASNPFRRSPGRVGRRQSPSDVASTACR